MTKLDIFVFCVFLFCVCTCAFGAIFDSSATQPAPLSAFSSSLDFQSSFAYDSSSLVDSTDAPYLPTAPLYAPLSMTADGVSFTLPVLVGTLSASQPVEMILDTGSFDMILFAAKSKLCASTVNCYDSEKSTSKSGATADSSTSLWIDSEVLTLGDSSTTKAYSDDVTVPFVVDRVNSPMFGKNLTVKSKSFQLVSTATFFVDTGDTMYTAATNPIHTLKHVSGIMGASFYSTPCVTHSPPCTSASTQSAFYQLLTAASGSLTSESINTEQLYSWIYPPFALDFNMPPFPSRLDVAGIQEKYRGSIQWTDRMRFYAAQALNSVADGSFTEYNRFMISDITVCGHPLLPQATADTTTSALAPSSWLSEIDTGASCLGMPAVFFDQLIRLFPIECPEVGVCYLPAGAASALPDFSFRVRGFTAKESSKKDGQLYISLSHLLLDADPNDSLHRRRFCLSRMVDPALNEVSSPRFVFGTRTLLSLYAVMHMSGQQVGFANKLPRTAASEAQCYPLKCKDDEMLDNGRCLLNPCSAYWMTAFDATTQSCRLSTGSQTAIVILLFLILAGEVGLYAANMHISKVIQSAQDHAAS